MRDCVVPIVCLNAFTALLLSIVVIVYMAINSSQKKEDAYLKQGLVQVSVSVPSTFTTRTYWVKPEDVKQYAFDAVRNGE